MRPFPRALRAGTLVRRYKRFLADICFPDGAVECVHCPNPGAMTGLAEHGSAVLVSKSDDSRRKLAWTWEMVRVGRIWVGVNTQIANRVVGHWLKTRRLFPEYGEVRSEVRRGATRFDFVLDNRCVLEVKSVTLASGQIGAFPDSVTERGRRHVEELARLRREGWRAVLFYFVARSDVTHVRPADEVDPEYGRALRRAAADGVEVVAIGARFTRRGVSMGPFLEVVL